MRVTLTEKMYKTNVQGQQKLYKIHKNYFQLV